jgi:YNFM family putative membrane transporter
LAFIPSYLHARFDVSLTAAGAILAVFGLGGLAYTSFAARLVASIGEQGLALAGGLGLGLGFLALGLAGGWPWAVPACFVIGLGFYMLHNTLQTNATQMAPSARGTAVSFFASAYYMGQALGVAAAARIVDDHDTRTLFAVATLSLPLIGGGFAYALRRTVRDNARSST